MTGREALTMAAHTLHETDLSIYADPAVSWINMILGELFDVANRRRSFRGEAPLRSLPQIGSLDEDLPYDEELIVRCMPKGLTARMFSEDYDNAQLGMYRQEYAAAVNECDRGLVCMEYERGTYREHTDAFRL